MKRKIVLQGVALLLVIESGTNVLADTLSIEHYSSTYGNSNQQLKKINPKYGGDIVYYYDLGSGQGYADRALNFSGYYDILGVRVNVYNNYLDTESFIDIPEPSFTNAFKNSSYNYGEQIYIGEDFNHSHTHNLYLVISPPIKKDIQISSAIVETKKYDGTTSAIVDSIQFSGLENSDILEKNIDYTASAEFQDETVGENKKVTVTVQLLDTAKT